MPLAPGTRLGPYEIVAPLGAGGMGEVFRATDTRLGREVAIKVLPRHLSDNAEVRARFEREAKTVSSLNHPHICTLFDVGREGGTDYLVMELVDGETLAQRLEKGALPADEVLRFGEQIADALDRAHRAGVIHRDLKPGNVMLTKSGAKLMDFGLARATGMAGPESGSGVSMAALNQSPTIAQPLTAEGTIVGTFQYMAPEQLEGSEADARSDLWGLGCVLYEMSTGRRAFAGKSQASLISSIMASQPAPISQVAPLTPPGLERLVQACLAKDPADRLQSAHDVRMQIAWLAEGGSQAGVPAPVAARRRSRERLAWTVAAVGLVAAAVLAWRVVDSRGPKPEAIQTVIDGPPDARINERHAELAMAPDGRTVAFVADYTLWVRPLASQAATRLADTEGAFRPFWSPDSRTIAYFREGKLMRVPAVGGSPTSVCDAVSGRGGSWSPDGTTIVFAPALGGPLMRVPASGGDPVPVTTLDSTRSESGHRFPYFLPDGEHFLFAALPGSPNGWDTYVGSLRSGTVKRLLTARSVAIYAEPGYLLFERDGRVLAQRFDPGQLELQGAPVSIADAPEPTDLDAEPVASASRNGRLAILRSEPADTYLETRDPTGATTARLDLPPAPWQVSSVAPDGRQAAVFKGDELWLVDLVRSVPMRFATNLASTPSTAWSPDGKRIAFVAKHEEREEIYIGGTDGRAELVPTTDEPFKGVTDWSRDGRTLVFWAQNAQTGMDLWILPMDGDRKPMPYLHGPADETNGRISPDGRWLAYSSNETGSDEIYVQSFPEPGRKVRISIDGGTLPGWRDGGRQLGYLNVVRREFVAVPVKEGNDFEPGPPHKVGALTPNITSGAGLGDTPGALVSVATDRHPRAIRLILDWTALLGQ
jgi:Tol biopolymer transport system component